jgi:hypothetical protein
MTVRLFFFLLVLANLLIFAWTQGHFGAIDDGHEPQRLEQQLHPEKLRIVGNAAAPAPTPGKDGRVCRVINGLKLAEAEAFRTALEAAGGYQIHESQTPWQELHRQISGQYPGGAVIEAAIPYQRIAQTRGLPRDSH